MRKTACCASRQISCPFAAQEKYRLSIAPTGNNWVLASNGAKCGAPHFAPNPESSKIRSRFGERALGGDLMKIYSGLLTTYGERRPLEFPLRFGRQGPVSIPDRTLT